MLWLAFFPTHLRNNLDYTVAYRQPDDRRTEVWSAFSRRPDRFIAALQRWKLRRRPDWQIEVRGLDPAQIRQELFDNEVSYRKIPTGSDWQRNHVEADFERSEARHSHNSPGCGLGQKGGCGRGAEKLTGARLRKTDRLDLKTSVALCTSTCQS